MAPADAPIVILLPDGAVLLTYPDGSALRIERDGGVSLQLAPCAMGAAEASEFSL